jgi:hypothetical protein
MGEAISNPLTDENAEVQGESTSGEGGIRTPMQSGSEPMLSTVIGCGKMSHRASVEMRAEQSQVMKKGQGMNSKILRGGIAAWSLAPPPWRC